MDYDKRDYYKYETNNRYQAIGSSGCYCHQIFTAMLRSKDRQIAANQV